MIRKALPPPLVLRQVRNLLIDRLTAEVTGKFSDAGIQCMLVKGPVIAEWLYPDGTRGYTDSDLLVPTADWATASAVLIESGFRSDFDYMTHPRMRSFEAKAFFRGPDALDLHCTLPGLAASPDLVWDALWEASQRQEVARRLVNVPGRPAVLLHLCLHAAHHHNEPKPLEDLRRGLESGDEDQWNAAVELARRLDGLVAFASGLRRLPEGAELARSLGVEHVRSVHFDLRIAGVPTAEGLHELLRPGLPLRERASLLGHELFPQPGFMRWWIPLARRGRRGLLASYPVRWAWLAVNVPGGFIALWRAQRRREGRAIPRGRSAGFLARGRSRRRG